MEVFNRIEQKYILNEIEYKELFKKIENHLEKDYYYKSNICNLYFDNKNNDFIVNSLEKPIFKEKIRLRSYDVPNITDNVFLEVKGKMKGVVFKRRIKIQLNDFYKYMDTGVIDYKYDNQVMHEIDYLIKQFHLKPKVFIGYNRLSYYDKDNSNFRITFDYNLRSRKEELRLENGDFGNLFNKKQYIMEIKSLGGIPLWFTKILSKMKIYSTSFSKYGEFYKNELEKEKNNINIKIKENNKEELILDNINYMEGKIYV